MGEMPMPRILDSGRCHCAGEQKSTRHRRGPVRAQANALGTGEEEFWRGSERSCGGGGQNQSGGCKESSSSRLKAWNETSSETSSHCSSEASSSKALSEVRPRALISQAAG